MEVSHLDTALDDNRVATVLDSYGTYLRDQGRASSLRIFEAACKSPVLEFGNVRICDLKVMHVQQWLDAHDLTADAICTKYKRAIAP